MARPLKVYALLGWAPSHWPVKTQANGNRQVRVVVAATSRAQAVESFLSVMRGESRYSLGQSVGVTGNRFETAAALSEPGTVFHATADMGSDYVAAPGQES